MLIRLKNTARLMDGDHGRVKVMVVILPSLNKKNNSDGQRDPHQNVSPISLALLGVVLVQESHFFPIRFEFYL
jgi:hypothetical protein